MQQQSKNAAVNFDWAFLLFLICVLNVKLYVKIFAIVFYLCYVSYKKYKFTDLPAFSLFYFVMPVIGTVASLLHHSFSTDYYWVGYLFGVLNWLIAGSAAYFLAVAATNVDRKKLIGTIKIFFLLNSIACIVQLGIMIVQSGQIMPYWYWEPTEYYGGSTGDHILGITGNISVTNATFNAIGTLLFLFYRELKWAVLTIVMLLLCTSNTTLILEVIALVGLFIIINEKIFRKQTLVVLLVISCIYPILSLDNIKYVDRVYEDEVEEAKKVKKKQLEGDVLKRENRDIADFNLSFQKLDNTYLSSDKYYRVPLNDTLLISYKDDLKYLGQFGKLKSVSNENLRLEPDSLKQLMERWYGMPYERLPLSTYKGIKKFYTVKQTLHYLRQGTTNLIFGAGIGNFSSKLAIKMTGLGIQGDYPTRYIYVSRDYVPYHLFSVLYLFSMPIAEHSILNMVNSVYNQVAGEYGLLGCIAFLLIYVGYVVRNRKKLRAGGYLFLMMMGFFLFEYWFELVSLTVLIEFVVMLELNSKKEDFVE
jgi:hypothetical protein